MSKIQKQKEEKIHETVKLFEVFMKSEPGSNRDKELLLILKERELAMKTLEIEPEEDFINNED
jgi:hypothetical protein